MNGPAMQVSNDWWPRFSDSEYERRYRLVREAMAARGLDCLLVYGAPIFYGTDPGAPNMVYLAGYAPSCQGYVVFPREGEPTLLIYEAIHRANALEMSVLPDVRGGTGLEALAVERVRELGCEGGRVGIVGSFGWSGVSIPVEHDRAFRDGLPGATFETVTGWFEELRLVKSEGELALMRAAALMTDRAAEAIQAMARPGVTDIALHNEALRVVHELGGRTPFGHLGSTSMLHPAMVYPRYYPLNRVVQRGDVIMTEVCAGSGGYFGKIYGTLVVGPPTAAYQRMLELAAAGYRQLYETVKPGLRVGDIQDALATVDQPAGLRVRASAGGWSTYNTPPSLFPGRATALREMVLQPGLCLNVNGWVMSDDERMGVWLGDTAVLTADGLRPLTRYPVSDLERIVLAV
jgi:Xaa-Pro aminopeptidase